MADKKKILIIGGTYFAGRALTLTALKYPEKYDVTLLNRGNRPIRKDGLTQLVADRHEKDDLEAALKGKAFDVVVDFCAYGADDIKGIFNSGVSCKRYIVFSTVDVYEPGLPSPVDETAPVASLAQLASVHGATSDLANYLLGKREIEAEIVHCAEVMGIDYTILRPSFIYGALDYTPRLMTYLKCIARGAQLPFPVDSDSKWSFIYYKDLANIVLALIDGNVGLNEAYNLAAPEVIDWKSFEKSLKALNDGHQVHAYLTHADINANPNLIHFPIDGDELFSGEKLTQALGGFDYTPFDEGLAETWRQVHDLL